MNIQIIGASGFVGTNLLGYLRNSSQRIASVSLRGSDWRNFVERDAQVYINLVGKAHDHSGVASWDDYLYVNVTLLKEIFEQFVNSSATLFIHVSSIAAIEEFESRTPLIESNPSNPISYYGKSKRSAEEWLLRQILPDNKKLVILRPPMIHGPGDKGNLKNLFKFISKGFPYPLSAFENKRSFISIENFCYYIQEILRRYNIIESGVYHVSDGDALSTNEVVEIIRISMGKDMKKIVIPKCVITGIARLGDFIPIPLNTLRLRKLTSDLLVSNVKINNELGIKKLPFDAREGLRRTINSFK